jgi:hypothetical protein
MKKLLAPVVIFITFWVVATLLYQITGNFFFLLNFGYIGTAVGVGTGLYFYPGRKNRWQGGWLNFWWESIWESI